MSPHFITILALASHCCRLRLTNIRIGLQAQSPTATPTFTLNLNALASLPLKNYRNIQNIDKTDKDTFYS